MKVVFTVDVEDWYHTSDLNIPIDSWSQYERRVVQNTKRILQLMDDRDARGTFFVLGCVAKEFPDLVRDIVASGHELACHGFSHQMLTRMTPDAIREDIRIAKMTLEDIGGVNVLAYRAPSWSIEPKTYFVLEILEELGFQVDSSFQPFRTPLSGVKNAPVTPFHPVVNGKTLDLLEIPSTVASLGAIRVPFSGGLYLRIVPTGVISLLARFVGRTSTPMMYIHPWEIDAGQPRIAKSPLIKLTHYYNLERTQQKLQVLLERFEVVSIRDMLSEQFRLNDNVMLSGTVG